MELKIGDKITVMAHVNYNHLKFNAVINPPEAIEIGQYNSTIRAIFKDEMEDENGQSVIEYTIETANGENVPLELIVKQ